MKKLAVVLSCLFLLVTLYSCNGINQTPSSDLKSALETLRLPENGLEVKENFNVPKQVSNNGKIYDVAWADYSSYVTVKDAGEFYIIQIDFENIKQRIEVQLVATVAEGTDRVSKDFHFFVSGTEQGGEKDPDPKPDPDPVKELKKVTFNNRLDTDGPLTEEAFPSIGSPKMLVIPVNLKSSEKTDKNLQEIKKAFTGSEEETGWESVQSYYYKSSYGKLDMQIEIVDEWFTPSRTASYYNNYSTDDEDGSQLILREALSHYDSRYNFNDYDYDKDGYIDGVWLIYNYSVNYSDSDSLFWAFTSWDFSFPKYDGVSAYYYAWAGIDFMHQTVKQAGYYDPTDIAVDAHTYIHETGHMMGLDDYYDYDEYSGANDYGFYGCDMMDFNIGDHSAVSKLLLGWVSPYVAYEKGSVTLDLNSFTATGEFIIISDHMPNSVYETYYTLEFYTNDGLNAHDKPYDSASAPYGIRIMEIHAEKNIVNGTVEYNSGTYQTGFKYDNSDESIMFANGLYKTDPSLYNDFSIDAGCLFRAGDVLKNGSLPFEITVNSMSGTKANITVTIK